MIGTFVLLILGIICCQKYENYKGSHDSSEIVIDEVVGILITMTWLPMSWQSFVLGFLMFRLLDIWKPLIIGMADKKIKGGLGVMADDVIAGILGNILLQVIYQKTDWLGQQLLL